MDIENITLISFGYFEQELIEKVASDVSIVYSYPVRKRSGNLDLSEYYDPGRRQYNGTTLIKRIDAEYASDHAKTLGLFNVDLFIPILTYIFGQAYLNGQIGIASVYRLGNERYGIRPGENTLLERFRKEVIHEIGHMFGLIHCIDPQCVMRSSTYVEDIDQKNHLLCTSCMTKLKT